MSTWWWVLLWVVLVLGGAGYLAARGWHLWGQVKELSHELAIAQERADVVQGRLQLLGEQISDPGQLAVFAGAETARRERDAARRTLSTRKQALKASSRPGWARDVH